jgi:ribosomal protein S18 acetylase RimI-like enzyme
MTMDDIPNAMRLKDLAGWNQNAADWKRFLSVCPEGCFAVETDSLLVGTVATMVYEDRLAWIGMVVVDPEHRGRGLGTALLERAIRHLDSRGIRCMKLDATPYGKPLYERFGFMSEYEIERWMLKRQAQNGCTCEQDVRDLEVILELDREIFGADRSRLLRSLAEAAPDLTLAFRQREEIAGYSFGRRGTLADHLGPWMARDKTVAASLLDEFLNRSKRKLVFVDCLCSNPFAVSLVKARGFELSRPLTRMFRGANEDPGRPEFLCGILGPEFG